MNELSVALKRGDKVRLIRDVEFVGEFRIAAGSTGTIEGPWTLWPEGKNLYRVQLNGVSNCIVHVLPADALEKMGE